MPQSSRLIITTTDADVPDGAALLGVETVNAVMGIRAERLEYRLSNPARRLQQGGRLKCKQADADPPGARDLRARQRHAGPGCRHPTRDAERRRHHSDREARTADGHRSAGRLRRPRSRPVQAGCRAPHRGQGRVPDPSGAADRRAGRARPVGDHQPPPSERAHRTRDPHEAARPAARTAGRTRCGSPQAPMTAADARDPDARSDCGRLRPVGKPP